MGALPIGATSVAWPGLQTGRKSTGISKRAFFRSSIWSKHAVVSIARRRGLSKVCQNEWLGRQNAESECGVRRLGRLRLALAKISKTFVRMPAMPETEP